MVGSMLCKSGKPTIIINVIILLFIIMFIIIAKLIKY